MDTILWLWHKCSMKPVSFCDCFGNKLKCHDIVCCIHRLCIFQIDLMLCRCHLVMRCLHTVPHIFHCKNNITSCILSLVQRSQIKISCTFIGNRRRISRIIRLKQEKFAFRSYVKVISHLFCLGKYLLKNMSRIAFVSCSIRSVNIADKSCNLSLLRPPRKNFKCIQIRVQIHIRFFDSGKSFYRRSIKHTFIIQCSLKLAYCNRYILHCSENIGELQPDKSHVFFLDKIQDIFSRIIFHIHTNPPVFTTHK